MLIRTIAFSIVLWLPAAASPGSDLIDLSHHRLKEASELSVVAAYGAPPASIGAQAAGVDVSSDAGRDALDARHALSRANARDTQRASLPPVHDREPSTKALLFAGLGLIVVMMTRGFASRYYES